MKLDVRWGYNNVRIKEGDEWKAAFITNKGLFEPLVPVLWTHQFPATFQNYDELLIPRTYRTRVIVVYMDDILIFTATLEEHRQVSRRFLRSSKRISCSKPDKVWLWEEPQLITLASSSVMDKIMMDPVKVQGVADWPIPSSIHWSRSFLGFINFYWRFIRDFQ